MNPIPIRDFHEGDRIQGFYLCVEKHLRTARTGELYLDLQFRDRTGTIAGKIWDKVEEFGAKFEAGDPVAVQGVVESFQDRFQIVVKKINRATVKTYGRYGYSPDLIVPTSSRDPREMWKETMQIVRSIENGFLRNLVKNLYQTHKQRLMTYPASMTLHHAYRSGFLEHVLHTLRLGEEAVRLYAVDRSLVLAGIALHDIGKLEELTPRFTTDYTDQGRLVGHIVLGWDMVRQAARSISKFPEDLLLKLEHILLSHQGRPEWQSPQIPKFPEALLVHHLDHLDAKMNLMETALAEDTEAGAWTKRHPIFRTVLFKGHE